LAAVGAPSAFAANLGQTTPSALSARHRPILGQPATFHHVPGRVRLKVDGLKHRPVLLEALRSELAAAAGVTSATANPLTGSLTVHYDSRMPMPDAVSALLRCCSPGWHNGSSPPWGEQIGTRLGEWLVENLAVALIAALV
jgi:hypothetical protein